MDNTTAVACVNNYGSMKLHLLKIAHEMLNWALAKNIILSLGYVIYIIQMEKNVHKRNSPNLCHNCDMFERETIDHVLFRCTAHSATRLHMWTHVLNNCPKG